MRPFHPLKSSASACTHQPVRGPGSRAGAVAIRAGKLTMIGVTIRGLAIALVLGLAAPAFAKEAPVPKAPAAAKAAAEASQKCIDCHSEAEPTDKSAAGKSVLLDPAKHAKSLHGSGKAACVDCHADEAMRKYPHKSPKPAQCESCHAKAVKEYATTIHGKARAEGRMVAATCSRLPRNARHQGHLGRRGEDEPREPRGDLRRLPRQREDHQGRQDPGRKRLGAVPRQHPRQAPGRRHQGEGQGPGLHGLPRHARHASRSGIRKAPSRAPTSPRPAAPATAR